MKKYELVAAVANETGVTQKDVNTVIDAMSDIIVKECRENGDSVNLPGLGIFKRKVNAARTGRNPLTGAALNIPESHTVKFTTSSAVKKVIEVKKKK